MSTAPRRSYMPRVPASEGHATRRIMGRALVAGPGECTRPVEIRRKTIEAVGHEAAYRRITAEALVGKLLDNIAEDDLFAAVLDK